MNEANQGSEKVKITVADLVKEMPFELKETLRKLASKGYSLEILIEQMKKFPFFSDKHITLSPKSLKAILRCIYRSDEIDLEIEYRKLLDSYENTINTLSLMITSASEGELSNSSKRKEVMDLISQKSQIQTKTETLLNRVVELRDKGAFSKEKAKKGINLLDQ